MESRRRSSAGLLLAVTLLGGAAAPCGPAGAAQGPSAAAPGGAPAAAGPIEAGVPLADALRTMQARGLRLLFSSRLVRPEMRVASPPAEGDPRRVLDGLLAAHGLAVEEEPGGTLVVVAAPQPVAAPGL